ncbi:MAG: hypothetical protein ACRYFS_22365 [Janthinobacterium lividum]
MKLLRTIFEELIGLFVDDWAFAGLVLLWVGLFALPFHKALGIWAGPVFFAGLAFVVLIFVARKARR